MNLSILICAQISVNARFLLKLLFDVSLFDHELSREKDLLSRDDFTPLIRGKDERKTILHYKLPYLRVRPRNFLNL